MNEFRFICAPLILDKRILKILSVTERHSYNVHAQLLFCSLNLLFSDVPVAVAVVVMLKLPIVSLRPQLEIILAPVSYRSSRPCRQRKRQLLKVPIDFKVAVYLQGYLADKFLFSLHVNLATVQILGQSSKFPFSCNSFSKVSASSEKSYSRKQP